MANPTFNNRSLQDENYITEKVNFRTRAKRDLKSGVISRRDGKKLTEAHIIEKVIKVSGIIVADTASGLQSAVDNLLQDTAKVEGNLVVESGRTFKATATDVVIPDRSFSQTMVRFSIDFICSTPFAEGSQLIARNVIASGINTIDLATTISGNYFNRPLISVLLPSGNGVTPITQVEIQNAATANKLTVSGSFNREEEIIFDYDNFRVFVAGTSTDYTGQFDEIEPGSNTFIVTLSGLNDGTVAKLTYNPRYW